MEMGLREGLSGETARIGQHLRCGMVNKVSETFLKYIKAILRMSPNNEGDIVSIMYNTCLIIYM